MIEEMRCLNLCFDDCKFFEWKMLEDTERFDEYQITRKCNLTGKIKRFNIKKSEALSPREMAELIEERIKIKREPPDTDINTIRYLDYLKTLNEERKDERNDINNYSDSNACMRESDKQSK